MNGGILALWAALGILVGLIIFCVVLSELVAWILRRRGTRPGPDDVPPG